LFPDRAQRNNTSHSKRSHVECDDILAGDTDTKMSDHDDPTESATKRSNNNNASPPASADFTEFDIDI